jgi:hypothetical protein
MGCDHSTIEERHQSQYESTKALLLSDIDNHLIFFKDSVTGLCFGGTLRVFTYVPCSPEIDRIAVPFNSTRK